MLLCWVWGPTYLSGIVSLFEVVYVLDHLDHLNWTTSNLSSENLQILLHIRRSVASLCGAPEGEKRVSPSKQATSHEKATSQGWVHPANMR